MIDVDVLLGSEVATGVTLSAVTNVRRSLAGNYSKNSCVGSGWVELTRGWIKSEIRREMVYVFGEESEER